MQDPHNTLLNFDVGDFFGEDGQVSRLLPGYEHRPEQSEMAVKIEQCLEQGVHTVIEAGTGTGKSFAYLVPALKYAVSKNSIVVISTHTINLQEQLINKDIPLIGKALEFDFKACIAKGRSNYLCKRRLKYYIENQKSLFEDASIELLDLRTWAETTEDGTLSSIPFTPTISLWDAVKSEHGNCRGRKCPNSRNCFYMKARKELESSQLIILNHSLLLSDLSLRIKGKGILPRYDAIIIDEAHNLERVAEDHFGINISNATIDFALKGLYDPIKKKGLLSQFDNDALLRRVANAKEASKVFFAQVQSYYENTYRQTNGKCGPGDLTNNISEALKDLRMSISSIMADFTEEEKQSNTSDELIRIVERLSGFETDIDAFVEQNFSDEKNIHIYWIEVAGSSKFPRYTLRSAPVDAGNSLRQCLFDRFPAVALTSATISCGRDEKGFAFFASSIGLDNYKSLQLGAIFDYSKNVKLVVETDLPEPSAPNFTEMAIDRLREWITNTHGGVLVLFTSYSMLIRFADELENWVTAQGRVLLMQKKGVSRTALIDTFKDLQSGVLFGTESFWQGVDVPGDALKCVVIMRLPFATPGHPLTQGKMELIRSRGENPFMSFQVPTAIIRFKQGFGRLVRRKTDSGAVVIFDSRIVRKFYGRKFIEALPACEVEYKTNYDC